MSITIKDVARHAGVSVATISRVVNNIQKGKVSASTRAKVLKTVEQLHYRPNQTARNLSKKTTSHIGLVLPFTPGLFNNSYYSELLHGMIFELQQYNYSLTLYNSDALSADMAAPLKEKQVDGLLITSPVREHLEPLSQFGKQTVLLNATYADLGFSSVDCDNSSGAQAVTEHLIGLGHRVIGCITGPAQNPNAGDRFEGFKKALEAHGIPLEPGLVIQGGFVYDNGLRAARKLLGGKTVPTAIFCANDTMALACLEAAREKNLSVPGDLSIAGFDDIDMATVIQPGLTTVRQEISQIGRRGIRLLMKQIKAQSYERKHMHLPVKEMFRQSCGAPRKEAV